MESKMWILSPSSNNERCLDSSRHDKDREGEFLSADLCENCAQFVEIHRFDQVKIESRFFAATDVLVCSEASESNGFDRLSPFCFGNYVIPSAVGKANVAQDDIEFL